MISKMIHITPLQITSVYTIGASLSAGHTLISVERLCNSAYVIYRDGNLNHSQNHRRTGLMAHIINRKLPWNNEFTYYSSYAYVYHNDVLNQFMYKILSKWVTR